MNSQIDSEWGYAMKTTTRTVREEFDEKGNLLVRETTDVVEEDSKPVTTPATPNTWPTPGVVWSGFTSSDIDGQKIASAVKKAADYVDLMSKKSNT